MREVSRPVRGRTSGSGDPNRELLPNNVRPVHYKLSFEPDLDKAETFDGIVEIELFVLERTTSITLHASDLEIHDTEIRDGSGRSIEINGISSNQARSTLTIKLKNTIPAPSKLHLKQTYTGSLLHSGQGFFRGPVKAEDGSQQWVATTQFEALGARLTFPCFDEPRLKATFEVTLIAESRYTRLANMDVAEETIITGSRDQKTKIATTFNTTPLMSTYLIAFAFGEFDYLETTAFRIPIRVYAAKYLDINQAKQALVDAARCLEYYERAFDVAYPLPKVDMLAVPGSRGAMENWGLVTYIETLLIFDEKDSSAVTKKSGASVILHELAHQWFGDIVTMKYWDGLWLNEAFADWATTVAFQELEPGWEMENDFVAQDYQDALVLDSNKASHPVEIFIEKDSSVNQIFDDITYKKGHSVIRMLGGILAEKNLIKGISNYLKKFSFDSSMTEDLVESLSEVVGYDVVNLLNPWIKSVGYPVLDVVENDKKGEISITQSRFLRRSREDPNGVAALYPVPLGLRTKDGVDRKTILTGRSIKLKSPGDFWKLNADQMGFYRVSYSPKRFMTLGHNAKDGLLSVADRIGIISDAFAFASSGFNGFRTSTALALLEMFTEDTSYFVWIQMINSINSVIDAWTFESESILSSLKSFKTAFVAKQLKKQGWDFNEDDDPISQLFKPLLFQNSSNVPDVANAAQGMFDKYIWGDTQAIDPNLREAVFKVTLANGDVKEFNALASLYDDTGRVEQHSSIKRSLGAAEDPDVISRVLELATSPKVLARNETVPLIDPLSRHPAGKVALWSWLKRDYDRIQHDLSRGIGMLSQTVKICVEGLGTTEQLTEARAFFEGRDVEDYELSLAQAFDAVEAKIQWTERDGEDVERWLRGRGYLGDSS